MPTILFFTILFLYGIVIGSFVNVVIIRLPRKESIVTVRSHCMTCGYQLRWYDLIPLFSWLALGGKCRKCKAPISAQYPLIEALNGILYVIIGAVFQVSMETLLYCLLASALIALSVIDWKTYEIPFGINLFILILGLIRVATDLNGWMQYVIGLASVSLFLLILYYASAGRAIGGGDVKLMAACGLLLGWQKILLAFVLGCILGACIHLIRMKVQGEGSRLAMGPYLSAGVLLAVLWGQPLIAWYLRICGF